MGAIHSTKIPTGPTGKRGPPQKVDPFFRNFSGWTEPIHWVLDRNFRKFWSNGSRPLICHHSNAHSCRIQICAWLKLQTKRQVLDFQTSYFATIKITWAKAFFRSAVKFNTIKLEMIFVWMNTWHTCVPNQWTFGITWCIDSFVSGKKRGLGNEQTCH